MEKCKITFYPINKDMEVPVGTALKKAMNDAGLDFDFPCGGRGRCGKCRVRIREGVVPPSDSDRVHFDEEELKEGYRLACTLTVQGDLVLELPQEVTGHKILIDAAERSMEIKPHLQKVHLEVKEPSIEDQKADWDRLRDELAAVKGDKDYRITLPALQALPKVLREKKFSITAVFADHEVTGLEAGDTTDRMLGIAFDIGTTTVVGYLMDLLTGKELGAVSTMNPQTKYGADVISRITYSSQEAGGLEILHKAIIEAVNSLIGEAVEKVGARREDVYALTFVGNSCMHHLLLGLEPRYIALAPYVPVTGSTQEINADELGIKVNPAGKVYVLPNIAGFVGADTIGVILATELDESSEIRLAIDIGTNGEMVLGNKDRLLACSTAAGPAFEGAQISCGMRGTAGAIDTVRMDDEFTYTTINDERPVGICGSGLIDVISVMLDTGVIDSRGRIANPNELAGTSAEKLADRIVDLDGMRAFLLAPAAETGHGKPLFITQQDVRELQLAKGAIATGVQILLDVYGIGFDDIYEVILAGAFGNYLDKHSACAIGLIPSSLEDRVRPVGNAAGTGAKVALLSAAEYRRSARIASFVEYEELAAYPKFSEIFANSLYFPEKD
ncbi:MAG: ASKHA domain-containing protein [Thermacetogeniaceae bacterium]